MSTPEREDASALADELLARERALMERRPALRRRTWLLGLALLIALGAGGAYFSRFVAGARGEELLLFTSLYVAGPLVLALALLYAYLRYPR